MAGFLENVGSLFTGADSTGGSFGSQTLWGKLGDMATADNIGAVGKIGMGVGDFLSKRKQRKADTQRFNKLFDFNKAQVNRTNRLEDERQATIDEVYKTPTALF